MNGPQQEKSSDVAFKNELLGIWQRALKNNKLTIDDDFFEQGGDSLLATQIVLEIEQLTGTSLPASILFETGTVRQLFKKIIKLDEFTPRKFFFIGPENGKIIHFFHGDLAHGGAFIKTFSQMLGDDYLIHAIAPHLPDEDPLLESIEAMAKGRLPKILQEQQDGPYTLLGRCNGALVAFEAARQIISMGKKVKAVIMIDPPIISVKISSQLILRAAKIFMHLINLNEKRQDKHLMSIFNILVFLDTQTKDFGLSALMFLKSSWSEKRILLKKWLDFAKKQPDAFKELEGILTFYIKAFLKYNPLPLEVPLMYISLEYSGQAWRRITENTVYINIHGGHHTSWKEDYSQDIVVSIRDFINR